MSKLVRLFEAQVEMYREGFTSSENKASSGKTGMIAGGVMGAVAGHAAAKSINRRRSATLAAMDGWAKKANQKDGN